MRFYQFIKENVVGLGKGDDMSTIKHLRNYFGSMDKEKNPGGNSHLDFRVEPHWSDKLYNVDSDNFSVYSTISPIDHKDLLRRTSDEIKKRGGIIHRELPAKNDIGGRATTTLEFVDRNSNISHAVVRSYDNRHNGLGYRHEVHVTQNLGGRQSDISGN